jgi:hypothetical protein
MGRITRSGVGRDFQDQVGDMVKPGSRTAPPASGARYGLLLLILIASYLVSAFNGQPVTDEVQIPLFAMVLLLGLRTSPLPGRWPAVIAVTAIVGSGVAIWAFLTGTQNGEGAADLWKALMLLLTAVLIIRRVLVMPNVTIQSIYGAVSSYLIIGLMFAACYAALDHLAGPPFFADNQPATSQTFQYFSFVTLTTLGYGDFTAVGNGGRAVAVLEALAGQVFLATLVARLVAAYGGAAARKADSPDRKPQRPIAGGPRVIRRKRPGSSRRP